VDTFTNYHYYLTIYLAKLQDPVSIGTMITKMCSKRLDNDIHISYVQFGLVVIEIWLVVYHHHNDTATKPSLIIQMAKLPVMGVHANE
jgi:hypothetical protein